MSFIVEKVATSIGGIRISEVNYHAIKRIEYAATVAAFQEHPGNEIAGICEGELDVGMFFHGGPTSSGTRPVLPVQSLERLCLRAEDILVPLDSFSGDCGIDLGVAEGDSTFYVLLRHTGTVDLVEA